MLQLSALGGNHGCGYDFNISSVNNDDRGQIKNMTRKNEEK